MVTKFAENDLIENKDLREEMIKKVEVLDRVKELILLPNTELMTTKMVAEYFDVEYETVKKLIQRNEDELTFNGMKLMKYAEIKGIFAEDNQSLAKSTLVEYGISTRGSEIFSKRAILNVAMLLRDSEIAKRVRTVLLDQQEVMSDEQKTKGITEEQLLLLNIIQSDSVADRAVYLSEYNNHKNRHIAELNVRIDEMKPKEDAFDRFIKAKNAQNINDVAKILNTGSKRLLSFLRENEIMMKVKNNNIPYQRYIDIGYFVVKDDTTEINGNIINHSTTYITPKGIEWISKLLNKHNSHKLYN